MKIGDIVRFVETWQIGIIAATIMIGTYTYHWVWVSSPDGIEKILLLESELDLIQSGQKMSLTF